MTELMNRLSKLFSPAVLSKKITAALPDFIVAIASLIFFFIIWKILKKTMSIIASRYKIDITAASFLQTVIKYTVLSIGFITALSQIGINITSLLTSIGILGITIGFAAKDALSNIISGIFIFWDRPFVLNDLVEIQGYYGRVEAITMRSTRIVTTDGKMLAIPNNTIVNQIVSSYTNFPHLRLDISVTVGVHEDLGKVRKLLLALTESGEKFLLTPAPEVVVTSLNDYNVAMELRVWLNNERDHISSRLELRERVFEVLRSANIDLPYETIQLAPIEAKTKIINN